MIALSRRIRTYGKISTLPQWGLVGLLWFSVIGFSTITDVDSLERFQHAHFLILGYVSLVIFTLRMASAANVRESMLLVYGICYAVFHFGIVPIFAVAPLDLESLGFNLIWWYTEYHVGMTAYLSAMLFLAGLCSALLVPLRSRNSERVMGNSNYKVSAPALLVLSVSVSLWFVLISTVGFGAYDVVLKGLHDGGLGAIIGIVHLSIAIAFILSVIDSRYRRKALFIFSGWAIISFPLGLRGEVAFPVVVAFGILASQGLVKVNITRIIAIALCFLLVSSAVFMTRVSTSDASFFGSASVARGVAELGGSIRPSYEVVKWLNSGDSLRMGETYYAPFERAFLRIFPISERLPATRDFRLMNVLVTQRAGPYGFSVSAEAMYNFGHIGAGIVGFLVGLFMRIFGRSVVNAQIPLVIIVVGFALFIHIRQAFVSSWSAAIFGFLISGVIYLSSKKRIRWRV